MFYMIVVIYDIAITICMIFEINEFSGILYDYEYGIVIIYETCMLVCYSVIPLSLRLIPRKIFL